ncbi:hypothetical protein [Streptomyces sp. AcE210]|uniref:hypothetical protein n=1 Tax=Streptomyces sp. AcE210 TaxID=2292703 RepID=UPI000E3059B7|nr:hypothetical protein [Streptomyces sp. AcE210]RFC75394.1 hypothetical protein DXZ75_12750 [Streptomyces sp. AcE210]
MRLPWFLLSVPVVALLAAVWLPFVNGPHLWLGLPSLLVWTVAWVLTLTPGIAYLERCRNSRAANHTPLEER